MWSNRETDLLERGEVSDPGEGLKDLQFINMDDACLFPSQALIQSHLHSESPPHTHTHLFVSSIPFNDFFPHRFPMRSLRTTVKHFIISTMKT